MDLLTPANRAIRALMVARGIESRDVSVSGHRVHYYRLSGTGSGPPVMLLHGLGSSANAFSRVFFQLQRHFRSIWAVDLPGNGFSPLPDSGPASLQTQVGVLLEFFRQQIQEPVYLVGNSLGGAMSMYAASEDPKAVRALTLVSPAGARVEPQRLASLKRSFEMMSTSDARRMTRRLFHRVPLAYELFAGQLKVLYGSAAVRGVLMEVKETDFIEPERLSRLSMPTMLVWGQSEKLLPYESINYFRENLPAHAEVHEVPGFGHIPQMEKPGELVDLMVGFARRHALIG
ncbi:MAG: alpha/beta fold hydrolase [Myxococcaceae bacterium]|nr:alpha/beta fold hydrolase [Myxococcaceae bacterium]